MFPLFSKAALAALLFFPFLSHGQSRIEDRKPAPDASGKNPKAGKHTVWNLDGGVFLTTDGHLPNGSCFRLTGHLNAPDFFDGLRRVDTPDGTYFTLHDKVVTTYPAEVQVALHFLDFPCTLDLKDATVRPPLTPGLLSALRIGFFWKDGIELRPVESSKRVDASARRLTPYSSDASSELAPRFEWNFDFTVNSESVPLTSDLAIVLETEDHKIAARVAARL
jgi:hypothetical protein